MFPWGEILSAILPALDKVLPDTAARDKAKAALTQALLDSAGKIEGDRAQIIQSEAQSESWLARSWRPLAMINFLALLDAYWMGYAPDYLVNNPRVVDHLFTLLTIGIGGYITGRSVEKASGKVAAILQGRRAAQSAPRTDSQAQTIGR